jgi:hypothetical protein
MIAATRIIARFETIDTDSFPSGKPSINDLASVLPSSLIDFHTCMQCVHPFVVILERSVRDVWRGKTTKDSG